MYGMEINKLLLNKVRVYGVTDSPEAYIIRDFLTRSVVTFEWVPVADVDELRRFLTIAAPDTVMLPVVELPDGKVLINPSIQDIALNLGWVNKPKHEEYDISIFGAGPAGLSAAVYAASEGLRTVLVERVAVGGQAGTSSRIENYLGFPNGITGAELAERARQQAVKFGVEILLLREGVNAQFIDHKLHVRLVDGSKIISKANICATGVAYSKLDLPEEELYFDRGVYYGAGSSEANLCVDHDVFIVGGGNSAGQAALNFCRHARRVCMVIRGNDLSSSMSFYLLERIQREKKIAVLFNSQVTALKGDGKLREIVVTNAQTQKSTSYQTKFLFVCIGGKPHTDWAKNIDIVRDELGYLVTGQDLFKSPFQNRWKQHFQPGLLETSVPGCFAAGDVRHNSIKRVASAVGEGAMAVTFVHQYLKGKYQ